MKGSNSNDKLPGTNANDVLKGRGGNDVLKGKSGNDKLDGGAGKDKLVGGAGDDLLRGGAGNDKLNGGAGNDVLVGGAGNDTLTGGAGRDTYVFNSLTEGKDTIVGFNATDDVIDLRAIFNKPELVSVSKSDRFTQFVQVVQVGANTEVRVDADLNGSGTEFTTIAVLKGVSVDAVSSNNFVVG
jgi:Ca2+-binding RTX toxin-like protein